MHQLIGTMQQVTLRQNDAEIGDVETGDEGTCESKISLLRGLDTVNLPKNQLTIISS